MSNNTNDYLRNFLLDIYICLAYLTITISDNLTAYRTILTQMAVAGVPVERLAFHPGNSLSGMTCLHAMEHPEKNHKEDNLFMLRKYI